MKNRNLVAGVLIMVLLMFNYQISKGCTNFLVTRGASTDGSTFITYAADAHTLYAE